MCSSTSTNLTLKHFNGTYVGMLTAALFTIVKGGNSPNVHSQMIHKMWSVRTVEYYLAVKRNEALTHPTTWENLENVMI